MKHWSCWFIHSRINPNFRPYPETKFRAMNRDWLKINIYFFLFVGRRSINDVNSYTKILLEFNICLQSIVYMTTTTTTMMTTTTAASLFIYTRWWINKIASFRELERKISIFSRFQLKSIEQTRLWHFGLLRSFSLFVVFRLLLLSLFYGQISRFTSSLTLSTLSMIRTHQMTFAHSKLENNNNNNFDTLSKTISNFLIHISCFTSKQINQTNEEEKE